MALADDQLKVNPNFDKTAYSFPGAQAPNDFSPVAVKDTVDACANILTEPVAEPPGPTQVKTYVSTCVAVAEPISATDPAKFPPVNEQLVALMDTQSTVNPPVPEVGRYAIPFESSPSAVRNTCGASGWELT